MKLARHVLIQAALAILCYALLAWLDLRIALAVFLVCTGLNIGKFITVARTLLSASNHVAVDDQSRMAGISPYTGLPRTVFVPNEERFPRILMPLGEVCIYTYDGGWNWQEITQEQVERLLRTNYVDVVV